MKLSDLQIISDQSYIVNHYTIRESEYNNVMLYEGLIVSAPRRSIQSLIRNTFSSAKFHSHPGGYGLTIEFKGKDFSPEIHQQFLHHLQVVGWFVSNTFVKQKRVDPNAIRYDKITPNTSVGYNIEPKYDIEVSPVPPILYHVTMSVAASKIDKIGLIPRSQNKLSTHPDRVYVTSTLSAAQDIANNFQKSPNSKPLVYYKINTSLLLRGTRFFIDPNFSYFDQIDGMYTLSNIPPNALQRIEV